MVDYEAIGRQAVAEKSAEAKKWLTENGGRKGFWKVDGEEADALLGLFEEQVALGTLEETLWGIKRMLTVLSPGQVVSAGAYREEQVLTVNSLVLRNAAPKAAKAKKTKKVDKSAEGTAKA